jgi:hypothetical protein
LGYPGFFYLSTANEDMESREWYGSYTHSVLRLTCHTD